MTLTATRAVPLMLTNLAMLPVALANAEVAAASSARNESPPVDDAVLAPAPDKLMSVDVKAA